MGFFAQHAETFDKDKVTLNPDWKPETNIPADVRLVKTLNATRGENAKGEEFARINCRVEVELEGELCIKNWPITSKTCKDEMIRLGIDDGSTFTVLKKGEGVNTKYEFSNVVHKPVVTQTADQAPSEQATA